MDFLGGKMKFKPIYFYPTLVIIILIVLIITINDSNKTHVKVEDEIVNKEMPNDEVHKGLNVPGKESPTKQNVTSTVLERLESMKKEVEKNPNDTLKLKEFADFLTAAHKPEEAIPYYEKILKIDPNNKEVLFNLSFIYNTKRDFLRAENYTIKILKLDPKDTQALYNLGAISASKGNKNKARDIWEKIVKDFPGTEIESLAKSGLAKL